MLTRTLTLGAPHQPNAHDRYTVYVVHAPTAPYEPTTVVAGSDLTQHLATAPCQTGHAHRDGDNIVVRQWVGTTEIDPSVCPILAVYTVHASRAWGEFGADVLDDYRQSVTAIA